MAAPALPIPRVRQLVLAVTLLCALFMAGAEAVRSGLFQLDRQLLDLRVFYCAGRVLDDGNDPYAAAPLRACEHVNANPFIERSPGLVLPFVLPGQDLATFALLARLPFARAAALFVALGAAALMLAAVLVARTTGVPLALAGAALALSAGLPSLVLGQIAPFELLVLCATAFALTTARERLAGGLAALALAEPHVGAFVAVTIGALVPRARLPLLGGAAALAAVAIACTSPASQGAYLFGELPHHAAAEVASQDQYSFSYLLTLLHAGARDAILLGAASAVALLGAAVAIAHALIRRGLPAAAAYVPAAFAVTGGTFVHLAQIALAVPAALMLLRVASPRVRPFAGAALLLLAVPWPYTCISKPLLGLTLVTLAVTAWHVFGGALPRVLALVAGVWLVMVPVENHPYPAVPEPVITRRLAAAPIWDQWHAAQRQMTRRDAWRETEHAPTWLGLAALAAAAFGAARIRVNAGAILRA